MLLLTMLFESTRQAKWMDVSTTSLKPSLEEVEQTRETAWPNVVSSNTAVNKDSGGQLKKRSIFRPNQQRSSSFSCRSKVILCAIVAESIPVYRDMSSAQSSEKRVRLLKSVALKKTQQAFHLRLAWQIIMLWFFDWVGRVYSVNGGGMCWEAVA